MSYEEYDEKYFNKPEHKPVSSSKKLLVRILSKTSLFSNYYYNIMKILDSIPENGKVLDLGCSHGGFLNFIHGFRPDLELYGLDISDVEDLLPDFVTFIQKDIINEKIKEKSFDFVHSRHLIEHLQVSDVPTYFERCHEVLKKGGVCFVLTPRWSKKFYSDPTHIRPYNKNSLRKFFEMSGFEDIHTFNSAEFNAPFSWIRRDMKLTFGFARK